MPGSKKKLQKERDFSSKADKELKKIQKKYSLSPEQLIDLLQSQQYNKDAIPLSIFKSDLGSFEAITKYLREDCNLKLKEIAFLLNRSIFTISSSYRASKNKHPKSFTIATSQFDIPTYLFAQRKLSILETIVHHLSSSGLKLSVIARHLSLDQRTVWTAKARAEKKLSHENKKKA